MIDENDTFELLLNKLTKDVKSSVVTLSDTEARYLVDTYYQMQNYRMATSNQCRAMTKTGEEHETLAFFKNNFHVVENQIKAVLEAYIKTHKLWPWFESIYGVGPIIASGLVAHLDITKAPTAGHFQAYAGLDPTKKWEKNQKRPWNAELKTICWNLGECFRKFQNREECLYGQFYKERLAYEIEKNENLEYADQAAENIKKLKKKDSSTYLANLEGKLSLGHLMSRSKRYAVKIFLSHLHYAMYVQHYGVEPPMPYAIAQLGHAHLIECPNKHLL